jgi:hypothetical protein
MPVAGLNDLDTRLVDIENACLMAPITEQCYVVAGDEFGSDLPNVFYIDAAHVAHEPGKFCPKCSALNQCTNFIVMYLSAVKPLMVDRLPVKSGLNMAVKMGLFRAWISNEDKEQFVCDRNVFMVFMRASKDLSQSLG